MSRGGLARRVRESAKLLGRRLQLLIGRQHIGAQAQELATRGLSSQMDKAYAAEKTDMAPAKIEEEEKAHA